MRQSPIRSSVRFVFLIHAPVCFQNIRAVQYRYDLLEIFFRYSLPFRNILQRDASLALMLCKIKHHAQCVASLCRDLHFDRLPLYDNTIITYIQ